MSQAYTGFRVQKIKFTKEKSIHAYYLHRNHSWGEDPELKTAGAWVASEEKHDMCPPRLTPLAYGHCCGWDAGLEPVNAN